MVFMWDNRGITLEKECIVQSIIHKTMKKKNPTIIIQRLGLYRGLASNADKNATTKTMCDTKNIGETNNIDDTNNIGETNNICATKNIDETNNIGETK